MRMVTMTHPDLDTEIEVPEISARIHERSGWRRKTPAKATATKATAAKKAPAPVADNPTNPPTSPDSGEES